jgi:RNA polymerase sigma-70 factor (ECF subfamily)
MTDQQLVALIKKGDEAAFGEIFERYRSRLYRFTLRFCKSPDISEEITHDVFLKIWTMQEGLGQVDNIATYLFTIARNKSLDHLRKVAREERLITELFQTMKDGHNDTQLILEANESSRLVQEAVDQLSPQKKLIYQLSRQEGLNHEQIAEQLHISKSTVNNHLVESLKQIRQYLSRHSPEALLIFAALALYN